MLKNRFDGLNEARQWVEKFVHWYNHKHCHSGIQYVTPNERHELEDAKILAKRTSVYQQARKKNPNRWSGDIRNWERVDQVELNPTHNQQTMKNKGAA